MLADSLDEANETVTMTLSSATNATISDATGTFTINDDDNYPTVTLTRSPTTAALDENSGTSVTITATLTHKTYAEVAVTTNGADNALEGSDYHNLRDSTITART